MILGEAKPHQTPPEVWAASPHQTSDVVHPEIASLWNVVALQLGRQILPAPEAYAALDHANIPGEPDELVERGRRRVRRRVCHLDVERHLLLDLERVEGA